MLLKTSRIIQFNARINGRAGLQHGCTIIDRCQAGQRYRSPGKRLKMQTNIDN